MSYTFPLSPPSSLSEDEITLLVEYLRDLVGPDIHVPSDLQPTEQLQAYINIYRQIKEQRLKEVDDTTLLLEYLKELTGNTVGIEKPLHP